MKASNKKLLIIAYHFPPDTEVGGIRPAKFCKYLAELGWEPYVLTIRETFIVSKDQGRMQEMGQFKIFRTARWPNVNEILLAFRDRLFAIFRLQKKGLSSVPAESPPSEEEPKGFLKRGILKVFNSIFELPDKQVGWFFPAVIKGYAQIRKEKIPIILTTAPPATASLIGYVLSKLTGARLVTDLRDPWNFCERKPDVFRTRLSDKIESWLENAITRHSTRVIATTPNYTDYQRAQYPDLPKENFCTIWNGFDSSDFKEFNMEQADYSSFSFSYLGTFYFGRTPKEFLHAVGELVRENIIRKSDLKIQFSGDVHYAEGVPVKEIIEQNQLSGAVRLSGKIPYREALRQMMESVCLLLFAPEQSYAIPAKTFEYLRAGKLILCFAKEGATADLIRKTGMGLVVDPYNVGEIKKAVQEFYFLWKNHQKLTPKIDLFQFERKELARQLSNLLQEIAI